MADTNASKKENRKCQIARYEHHQDLKKSFVINIGESEKEDYEEREN